MRPVEKVEEVEKICQKIIKLDTKIRSARIINSRGHLMAGGMKKGLMSLEAQKKVNLKSPEVPQDVEQIETFKRIWIDVFDNDFTELFDSKKFGANYGKLVSKELELTKHWNNITNVILQSVNLPSKEEIDEVYKELHSLKKRITKLEIESKKKKIVEKNEK